MIPVFSFNKPVVCNILECAGILFPGIRKAIAVYYNKEQGNINCLEFFADKNMPVEIENNKYPIDILKERENDTAYQWINPDSIGNNHNTPHQLGIYDEFENNVLLVRIKNPIDKLNDLLYLYMNKHMPVFQIEHNQSEISGREKTMLARSIVNNIQFLQKQTEQDKYLFSIYNQSVLINRTNLSDVEKQLEEARQNYAASIIAYCRHQITQIATEIDRQIQLAPGALKMLSEYKGEFKDLESILRNSIMVAINFNSTLGNDILIIEKQDITFDNLSESKSQTEPEKYIVDRYSRTRELLNRYENAARETKEKGLPVTGKNIGMFCHPSISAPAISDSLLNHQKKIITLLNESPEKWPVIRNEFRSIINLQNKFNQKQAYMR